MHRSSDGLKHDPREFPGPGALIRMEHGALYYVLRSFGGVRFRQLKKGKAIDAQEVIELTLQQWRYLVHGGEVLVPNLDAPMPLEERCTEAAATAEADGAFQAAILLRQAAAEIEHLKSKLDDVQPWLSMPHPNAHCAATESDQGPDA